jgi:hypothetical protein
VGALVTAVVLSPSPIGLELEGIEVVNFVSVVKDHTELNLSRREAINHVGTSHFFYLDSDDELPPDYLSVLDDLLACKAAVAYTDELVRQEGKEDVVRRPGPYDQRKHLRQIDLLHHLVLYETHPARRAAALLPEGIAMFELMLSFQLAKQSAGYVPRIGYHWNRAPAGTMHTRPDALRSVCSAAIWANRNKT